MLTYPPFPPLVPKGGRDPVTPPPPLGMPIPQPPAPQITGEGVGWRGHTTAIDQGATGPAYPWSWGTTYQPPPRDRVSCSGRLRPRVNYFSPQANPVWCPKG